ncbi:MAG TPA: pyruvate ferredoxin oxidoreductase [Firmicutes bacterium]|nr:pyruvate ferredoxin oxidoreductase [Bacillota bacterium]
MPVTLKELAQNQEAFTGGHRACAGCMFPVAIRQVMANVTTPVVVINATGCMEVTTVLYPYTAWRVPWMHAAFENSAAVCSGIETAYRSLKRQGRLPGGDKDVRFIAFGGDGGTYDIGFQSLSGAMERGHRMVYICYDNQAYENTGIQRSSATPKGAATTTSPVGRKDYVGKKQWRKDLTAIMAAHDLPYVAQAAVSHWQDLSNKVRKALDTDGPAFLNVLAPCRLGWAMPPEESVGKVKEAVESCFWPLYEVDHGQWRLTYKPRVKLPYAEWLKNQARFKHLFTGQHDDFLAELQAEVDARWEALLRRCGSAGATAAAPEIL